MHTLSGARRSYMFVAAFITAYRIIARGILKWENRSPLLYRYGLLYIVGQKCSTKLTGNPRPGLQLKPVQHTTYFCTHRLQCRSIMDVDYYIFLWLLLKSKGP